MSNNIGGKLELGQKTWQILNNSRISDTLDPTTTVTYPTQLLCIKFIPDVTDEQNDDHNRRSLKIPSGFILYAI